jgi:hypothetical protein
VKIESNDTQIPVEYSMLTGSDVYLATSISAAVAKLRSASPSSPNFQNLPNRDINNLDARARLNARTRLNALGGKFDSHTFATALQNDDASLMQALIESGWRVTVFDLIVKFDPRESNHLVRQWPVSTMTYLASSKETWGAQALLCEPQSSTYLNEWRQMLVNGYDATVFDSMRSIFNKSIVDNADFAKPRGFYINLCGSNSLQKQ